VSRHVHSFFSQSTLGRKLRRTNLRLRPIFPWGSQTNLKPNYDLLWSDPGISRKSIEPKLSAGHLGIAILQKKEMKMKGRPITAFTRIVFVFCSMFWLLLSSEAAQPESKDYKEIIHEAAEVLAKKGWSYAEIKIMMYRDELAQHKSELLDELSKASDRDIQDAIWIALTKILTVQDIPKALEHAKKGGRVPFILSELAGR